MHFSNELNEVNEGGYQPLQPQLVVMLKDNAGTFVRENDMAEALAVTPKPDKQYAQLQRLLNKHKAQLIPFFSEESYQHAAANTLPMAEIWGKVKNFFQVKYEGNLKKFSHLIRKWDAVKAAYIQPAPEPPVLAEPPAGANPGPQGGGGNFFARQHYLEPSPVGVDAFFAWQLEGGKGAGVNIIDIEGNWNFMHEDLALNQGGIISGVPIQTPLWRHHGTAVAGVVGADDNGLGIRGISPDANLRAISIGQTEQWNVADAIRTAANALQKGDIIVIELHFPGPGTFQKRLDQKRYIPAEWWPDILIAIQDAVSKGIIVVEAAGNGGVNLDDAIYDERLAGFPPEWLNPFRKENPQSGAILVGAGAPPPGTHGRDHGADRSRLAFSNWGERVDVQGWGKEVTTCGFGGLTTGPNENLFYTDTFAGTSSATSIVAGVLACVQGRLRAKGLPLLDSASAIDLLRRSGFPQQPEAGRPETQRIGNRPDLRQLFTLLNIAQEDDAI